MDIRFKNVGHIMWCFAPPAALFLDCELQWPVYTTPVNFTDIIVMLWAQWQILN